jgi:hypothetical protein
MAALNETVEYNIPLGTNAQQVAWSRPANQESFYGYSLLCAETKFAEFDVPNHGRLNSHC